VDWKDISIAIDYHYYLQKGCFFSEYFDTANARFAFSCMYKDSLSFIWNHCFPTSIQEREYKKFVDDAIVLFRDKGRKPAFYLDHRFLNSNFEKFILNNGFKCLDNEAWMFLSKAAKCKANRAVSTSLKFKEVETAKELSSFFNICRENFDEEHSIALTNEYLKKTDKKVQHFIGRLKDEDLAIFSLYSKDGFCTIHNVAVANAHQQKGLGNQTLDRLCELVSQNSDFHTIYLQCDGGGYHESFYAKEWN